MNASSLSPLSSSTVDRLKQAILAQEWAPGQPLPSERELALRLGVSRQVVRQAVAALVNFGLLDQKPKCRPVVRPRASHSSITGERLLSIWLWPHLSAFSSSLLFRGIQRALPASGDYKITVGAIAGEQWSSVVEAEAAYLRRLAQDSAVAGALVWPLGGQQSLEPLMAATESGLPMVFVDRLPPDGVPGDFVGTDNFSSARAAVQHLIQLGHQRIACAVNLDSSSSVHERAAGWRAALDSSGAATGVELRPVMTMDGDMRQGFEAALKPLMDSPDRPTAIFAINDMVALIIHDLLVGWGYAVPGDVSLVGFDGEMRWIPGGGYLTTMVQNFERMGELAMTLLIDRIEGRLKGPSRCHYLEAPLAHHASTGPPPSALLQEGTSISL